MTTHCLSFSFAIAALSVVATADAQQSRVFTATLPIPMSATASKPLPPDRLRATSPWTQSLAGTWRFKITKGQILDGHFALSNIEVEGLRSSGDQDGNPAINAFDGKEGTRWCAPNGDFPQYIQARIDTTPRVATSVDIVWERDNASYQCRIEGGTDGVHWRTLLDKTSGVGNGPLTLPEGKPVRYIRVLVTGASEGSWASIRELKIHYKKGAEDVVWHPKMPSKLAPTHADDFVATAFDDKKWDKVAVPSNWEMAGYSIPTYNSVDDSVGLYRKWVDVPAAWQGRHIVWRFDGALDGAEVYVNGKRAGYHESGYTAFDVDVTGLLKPGQKNLLAVRVSKMTPSVDCETGDYQCMGGIYRDTRLIAVPVTHVADLTVQTPLTNNYHDANLKVMAKITGTPGEKVAVTGYITDAKTLRKLPVVLTGNVVFAGSGRATLNLSAPVKAPHLWSAEKPNLYYLTLDLHNGNQPVERVEQRFGFRQVEIKKDIVLWNGKPIKCTGICRHDFWPNKGFALTDAEWKKDLTLMKATNINAIRTSHYNHASRFLELCEERGFYILDEVPFCWVGDKVKDPSFAPPLLQRAAETVARDKNRPCVLAWSLGNENPVGIDTQKVHDLVTTLDPTRPSFASQAGPGNVKGQQLFDAHYPSPGGIQGYIDRNSRTAPEVITEHPHTFYQRETQDYDPGASDVWSEGMIATWDLLRKSPTILGSFIWEWQSQGIADKFPDHSTDFYYGKDHMRQENNKGIMSSYRKPKAEQWIVKMVYSPVDIATRKTSFVNGAWVVPVANRYSFTDLSELKFRWTALKGDAVVGHGVASIACPPGLRTDAKIAAPADLTELRLVVDRADGTNVTMAHLSTDNTVPVAAPSAVEGGTALTISDGTKALELKNSTQTLTIDKKTGAISRWTVAGQDRLQKGGLFLNLGETRTSPGDHYYRAPKPPVLEGTSTTAESLPDGSVHVVSTSQVHPKTGSKETLGTLIVEYTVQPSAEILVHWNLEWTSADSNLWEIGLGLNLPASYDQESWSRNSYFTAYPAGHISAPSGTAEAADAAFRASKRSLHFLSLTDKSKSGVALIAADLPLIGRVGVGPTGVTLFASSEAAPAGPDDLSWSWFHSHDIKAQTGQYLSGEFILRAIGAQ